MNMGFWKSINSNDTRRTEVNGETSLQWHLPPHTRGCSNQVLLKLFVEVCQGTWWPPGLDLCLLPAPLHCGQESRDMEKIDLSASFSTWEHFCCFCDFTHYRNLCGTILWLPCFPQVLRSHFISSTVWYGHGLLQIHLSRHSMLGATLSSTWGRSHESLLYLGSSKHIWGFYYTTHQYYWLLFQVFSFRISIWFLFL